MSEISSERMDWLDRVKTLMTVLVLSGFHPLLKFASLLVSGTALSLLLGAPIRGLPGLKKLL
jgi:hypothetical protein